MITLSGKVKKNIARKEETKLEIILRNIKSLEATSNTKLYTKKYNFELLLMLMYIIFIVKMYYRRNLIEAESIVKT